MKKYFIGISLLFLPLYASSLSIGPGVFNIVKGAKSLLLQCEYSGAEGIYTRPYLVLRPLLGGFITSNASLYAYGGLQLDFPITHTLHFRPSFSPGVYFKGSGKDMGFPLEFRSALDLLYRTGNDGGIGAQFYHISNGTLGDTNPGTECLVVYYSFVL